VLLSTLASTKTLSGTGLEKFLCGKLVSDLDFMAGIKEITENRRNMDKHFVYNRLNS